MKNVEIWKDILEVLFYLEDSKRERLPEIMNDAEAIIDFRSTLREKINRLQNTCEQILGHKTAYYLMFPIIVYTDEYLSKFFSENSITWPKMQKEIYNTENGGERIYHLIDQVIEQPTYPEIVYQVNYAILKTEFKGKLIDEDNNKNKQYYLNCLDKLLVPHITQPKVQRKKIADLVTRTSLKEYSKRYFYIPAIITIGFVYIISLIVIGI